ncbi:aspartyl/asparaginyl beta-hydroxylase domain-containing protein [Actinomadura keratinilytica]|uniref:Aspartyl/asparaginy/proline hydroxylase domain-containing protein n=1 Tax=Actinomadura keratinilytica TaxID=547461 RepID=A0ABP7YPC4_9ACTN
MTGTATAAPAVTALDLRFDVAPLAAEVRRLRERAWRAQRPYGQNGLMPTTVADWTILPLRSPGGDPARTDPGGAGLLPFADTPHAADCPALGAVMAAVPAPLRAVRLMALGPGAQSPEHRDSKIGLPYGTLRLHVPITTNPGAVVVIEGAAHHWEPGRLWYGDFNRPHLVRNTGDDARIHLVLDTLVTPELLRLFPADVRDRLPIGEVLFARPPVPLPERELAGLRRRFMLPAAFRDWSEDEVSSGPDLPAQIVIVDGEPVLEVAGEPAFGLVHLGAGEFRLRGWSEERTLHIASDGRIRMWVRAGRRLTCWERPSDPCAP